MKYRVLAGSIVAVAFGLGAALMESEMDKWSACQSDADCINITYPCAGGTVNKRFAKPASELFKKQNSVRDCELPPPKKDDPPFRVFCRSKKCESQGRNPEVGFS